MDAFQEAREELRLDWLSTTMKSKHRILEIQSDLEVTQDAFKRTRSPAKRLALNKLRYLLIKEKNLLSNKGKDDWGEL